MIDINHLGIMFISSNPNHTLRVLICAPNFPEIECCQCLKYLDEYSKQYPDRLKDILYKIKGPGFFYVYGVLCCNERGWIDMFNFIPHEYFYTLPELGGGVYNNFPWTDEGLMKVRDKLIKATMMNVEDLPNHRLIGKPNELMDIRDPLPKKQDLGFYEPQAFHTLCENTVKILHEWDVKNMSDKEIQKCVEKISSIEKELLEKKEIFKQKLTPHEGQILQQIQEEKQEGIALEDRVKFEGYPDV